MVSNEEKARQDPKKEFTKCQSSVPLNIIEIILAVHSPDAALSDNFLFYNKSDHVVVLTLSFAHAANSGF